MGRRRRSWGWGKRIGLTLAAVLLLYCAAALVGSLIPVNRGWTEPDEGTTVFLRSNGIHVDLIMPAKAQGLDWRPLFPAEQFRRAPEHARWFAFGAGERQVYLETPTWWDLTPRTLWAALTGGEQVMKVERTNNPGEEMRAIRLRPEEYRRLWAAVRAQFTLDHHGRPRRIDHPGYTEEDRFFVGTGRASAVHTCNNWVADKLRLAGVKVSVWPPFAPGLLWRYREVRNVEDRSS